MRIDEALHQWWPVHEGARLIKHWSATHKTIALISGEAELAGIVKGAAEGMGIVPVALDLGVTAGLAVMACNRARMCICARRPGTLHW